MKRSFLARVFVKGLDEDDAGADPLGRTAWRTPMWLRALSTFAITLACAALLVLAVEIVARGSVGQSFAFLRDFGRPAWSTILIFSLLMTALDAMLGRRLLSPLILAPPLLVLAWTGSQKSYYLGDPLYPTDFLYYRQIVELLPLLVRDRPLTAIFAGAGIVVAFVGFVVAWLILSKRCRPLSFQARALRLVVALPLIAFVVSILDYRTFSWTRDRLNIIPMMWDQKENYAANGFALAFALNLPMATVAEPQGYGAEALNRIAGGGWPAATVPEEKPDIVIVMSESYWDASRLPGVKILPDPIPTTRALQSGHVFSPEFGGMTANVEFEALTGFSNAFLPYGSIPYQQYIRDKIPSLATFLGDHGYETTAIHPFTSWFWNRGAVYDAFGFDRFLSEETLPALEKRGPLASDAALTEEIIREVDAAQSPAFVFAVSLQGHGPYEPNRYPDATHAVVAPKLDEAVRGSIATFAEGAADADRGLQRLIDWARNRDRPTVIALFGDHLPPLGPAYVATGFMKEPVASRRAPLEEMKAQHETPLVVWSNRRGRVKKLGSISPAFLPLQVLKAAGIEHPYYTGFLGKVHAHYRIVDRNLLVTRGDEPIADWGRAKNFDPLVGDYRLLQYDMMFGERNVRHRFFPGTRPRALVSSLVGGTF